MKIREYREQDRDEVIALWRDCGLVVPQNDPAKDIQRKLQVGRDLFLVGEGERAIVASVMGGYDGHRGWINYLAVKPSERRHGLGRQMMHAVEARIRQKGCPKINLQVAASGRQQMIRPAAPADAGEIANIYNHYIAGTVVTFEEELLSPAVIGQRIRETQGVDLPWLVAVDEAGKLLGYAYASKWNGRCAYRFAVEITVYMSPEATGCGWGTRLYKALFAELRKRSMHVVIGGIALPNAASVALHENFGMQKVAHFSEVGFKFGCWIDVGYWQGILDDRST